MQLALREETLMLLQKELEQQQVLMEPQQLSLVVGAVEVGVVVQLLEMLVELAVEVKEVMVLSQLVVQLTQMEQTILEVVEVVQWVIMHLEKMVVQE